MQKLTWEISFTAGAIKWDVYVMLIQSAGACLMDKLNNSSYPLPHHKAVVC